MGLYSLVSGPTAEAVLKLLLLLKGYYLSRKMYHKHEQSKASIYYLFKQYL